MRVRVSRSARKHKIGNARILAALRNAGDPIRVGDRLIYIAADDRGVELEIVLVPDDRDEEGWTIIHAMPATFRE